MPARRRAALAVTALAAALLAALGPGLTGPGAPAARATPTAPPAPGAASAASAVSGADSGAAPGADTLDLPPPGSNDWSCRPSEAHPNPVVLVHGLGANQADNWSYLSPVLARAGYCVFSLTYGRNPLAPPPLSQVGGLVPMERSARELAAFVDRVRDATGAAKVDIVGHSEGSLMPDHWVRFLGGDAVVDHYVGMTPLWDGTRQFGLAAIDRLGRAFGLDPAYGPAIAAGCGSCRQFLHGSAFLRRLAADGGPAAPGVTYTMILTRYDELVVPYTSGLLAGARNIVLQDVCPTDTSEHAAVAYDPVNAQLVLHALDPDDGRPIRCTGPPR